MTKVIRSKLLNKHTGSWVIETDSYAAFSSLKQISGIINFVYPHITQGYWDDPFLVSKVTAFQKGLIILGAGIGGYLPQIRSCNKEMPIIHVEYDREIADVLKSLCHNHLCENDKLLIHDAYDLGDELFQDKNVYVDLYNEHGILFQSFSNSFLKQLSDNAHTVTFNVFDEMYDTGISSTHFALAKISKFFDKIILIRRVGASSICAYNGVNGIFEALSSLEDELVKYSILNITNVDKDDVVEQQISEEVLLFDWQKENRDKGLELTDYMQFVSSSLQNIGKMELLKASRKWKS